MPENDVTLALEGEVTLADFAKIMANFTGLMDELSNMVASTSNIVWVVDELEAGSAEVTAVGVSEQIEAVQRTVRAYEVVAEALADGNPIPYPPSVIDRVTAITQVINGRISAVRFQTSRVDTAVYARLGGRHRNPNLAAFGMVKGRVETLKRRKKLEFTLYDDVLDKPITCSITPEQEEVVRDIWGKRVTVTGLVERDPEHGYPRSVKEILNIDLVAEAEPGSYQVARGIIPWQEGDELPEVAIKRVRNAY